MRVQKVGHTSSMCRRSDVPTLPWRPLAALCTMEFAHFYSISSVSAYAGFLSVDNSWAPNLNTAGRVSGLLSTALVVGRLCTTMLWGILSDKYGRRPLLIWSMVSVALGNLCFAFAAELWLALLARFLLLGAGCAYATLACLVIKEVYREQQGRALGMLYAAGGVVQLTGPGVAGWTYSHGARYPALVPSVVGVAISLGALGLVLLWLPESRPPRAANSRPPTTRSLGVHFKGMARKGGGSEGGLKGTRHQRLREEAAEPSTDHAAMGLAAAVTDADEPAGDESRPVSACGDVHVALCGTRLGVLALLRAMHGFVLFASFELIPLWAVATPSVGGLGIDENLVGTMLAVAAAGAFLFALLLLSRLLEKCACVLGAPLGISLGRPSVCMDSPALHAIALRYGPRRSAFYAALIAACAFTSLPLSQRLLLSPTAQSATVRFTLGVAPLCAVFSAAVNLCGAALITAINDLVDASHAYNSGQLNGAIVALETLAKALGPFTCAPLFAWAISGPLSTGADGLSIRPAHPSLGGNASFLPEGPNAGHGVPAALLPHSPRNGAIVIFALVATLLVAVGAVAHRVMRRSHTSASQTVTAPVSTSTEQ